MLDGRMRSARTRWGLLPWALFCHLLVTSLIPPPVSKLPQYATDSLKALQRGTFVLRINGILRSSHLEIARWDRPGSPRPRTRRPAPADIMFLMYRIGRLVAPVYIR